MSRDLLTETIEATKDLSVTQEEGSSPMSYPPSYSSGSCPESAGDVTINQTVIDLGADEGAIKVDKFTVDDFDVTKKIVTLTETPLDSYPVDVHIKGVGQVAIDDYSVSGTTLTFVNAINDADVVTVRYAHEV